MLIRNYGLFWRRDVLEDEHGQWTRNGELVGIGVRKKRQRQVDFANQRGVYALYDENFRLIYVGQAGRGERRLYPRLWAHTRNNLSERWSRFSWFGLLPVFDEPNEDGYYYLDNDYADDINITHRDALNHLEAVLIMAGEPARNAKGGVFGREVTHYRQSTMPKRSAKKMKNNLGCFAPAAPRRGRRLSRPICRSRRYAP